MVDLVQQLRSQRESWAEVAPGKRIKIRRPQEAQMFRFRGGISAALAVEFVVGWEGITEADLLGASLASQTPAVFSPELVSEVLLDRMDWVEAVSVELRRAIEAHIEAKAAAAKN
jgi:hypothetical protein